jgi:hypothetical protein
LAGGEPRAREQQGVLARRVPGGRLISAGLHG